MYAARAGVDLTQVVMAYLGVQYKGAGHRDEALATLRHVVGSFGSPDGPGEYDTTHHLDAEGYDNLIAVGYWRDPETFRRWSSEPAVATRWDADERSSGGIGLFRGILSPRADRFETIYSFTDDFPGVGAIMDGVSGEIREHSYWGSMRERVPLSQTDRMVASGDLSRSVLSAPTRRAPPWVGSPARSSALHVRTGSLAPRRTEENPMSDTNGLATSIGILAGVSVFVTGWIGMPTWLLFLAWLTYFFCGGGTDGLKLQLATNLFGVLIGVVTLGIVALVNAPQWLVALLVVVAAFTIAQSGRISGLRQTPGGFVGFAMIAAAVQVTGKSVLEPSWSNPIVLAVGAVVLASVFAVASELGGKVLSGRSLSLRSPVIDEPAVDQG
ncbi:MAG: hypothetical protein ABS81_06875 [Pseudonocardia sp. SCN 72-86]|nr:MAG: hypothetical protein ABS81_06875 [Pseudonocardia sp. SCN 72-86]